MTVSEFVQDLFDSCRVTPEHMTKETAVIDLDGFLSEGWILPDGITPESYADAWNELVSKQNND